MDATRSQSAGYDQLCRAGEYGPEMDDMKGGGGVPEIVVAQPGQYCPPPYYNQPPPPPQSQTTVIVTAPPQPVNYGPRNWSSGICDCFQDCGTCMCGWFCMSCLLSSVAGKLGESCCVPFCVPGGTINLRTKLRTLHRIEGSIMKDCCMACFCRPCMVCQMDRELDFVARTTPMRM